MHNVMARSPGKIILLGEHAVVYDEPGIATTIGEYSDVEVSPDEDKLKIDSNLGYGEKSKEEISDIIEQIDKLRENGKIDEIREIGKKDKFIPSFVVAGKIMERAGFEPCSIEINSEVPKNLGSSASVFSGIAAALSDYLGLDLEKDEIGFFANEGDRIAHGNPSGIDAQTITHGGANYFQKGEVKPLEISDNFLSVIVDSGELAKTGEAVGYVKQKRESNPEYVNSIMKELGDISRRALSPLKSGYKERVGKLMTDYYNTLRKLDISTPKLDKIVELGLDNGALGAKPTGGWQGGNCLVLVESQDAEDIIEVYREKGFNAYTTKLGVDGVKTY